MMSEKISALDVSPDSNPQWMDGCAMLGTCMTHLSSKVKLGFEEKGLCKLIRSEEDMIM